MVDAKKIGGVVSRRIIAANSRGDNDRARHLQSMLTNLKFGRTTAGQVLIDMQNYAKARHKVDRGGL
jgi:hypothetical protein